MLGTAADWQAARYERKLRVPELRQADIEPRLRLHRAAFAEIHGQRQVNNVYFDTPDLRCCHDNLAGTSNRFKVRLRWYGAEERCIDDAVLEIKRKRGFVGIKDRYALGPMDLALDLDPDRLARRWERADLLPDLRLGLAALVPVLFNRYRRRYYRSADGRFRATIDDVMHFRQILRADDSFRGRELRLPGAVVELKYAMSEDSRLPDLVGDLPYRVSRNSKYVTGIRATWR